MVFVGCHLSSPPERPAQTAVKAERLEVVVSMTNAWPNLEFLRTMVEKKKQDPHQYATVMIWVGHQNEAATSLARELAEVAFCPLQIPLWHQLNV